MTKSTETEIAILQTQMTTVQTDVTEMKSDIKTILSNQENSAGLESRIVALEARKTFQSYIIPIISAFIASLLTFLVISYFTGHQPNGTVKSTTTTNTTEK
jgi:hypothetical protein